MRVYTSNAKAKEAKVRTTEKAELKFVTGWGIDRPFHLCVVTRTKDVHGEPSLNVTLELDIFETRWMKDVIDRAIFQYESVDAGNMESEVK